jgi:hypothetical protein
MGTDDPEPAPHCIEGETSPDGEVLERLVVPEGPRTKDASAVHEKALEWLTSGTPSNEGDEIGVKPN